MNISTHASSSSSYGNIFYQRRPSLTTACPPPDKRKRSKSFNKKASHTKARRNKQTWAFCYKSLLDLPLIQLIGWSYVMICLCLSTVHLFKSFLSLKDPLNTIYHKPATVIDWDKVLQERQSESPWSSLDDILPAFRLSKMFSKSSSVINYHHDNLIIRPYWFTASIKPARDDSLTLITVVELKDLSHLIKLAELYQSSISATLLVPSENIHDEYAIQQLTKVRQMYETTVALRRHVDIHLVLQPSIQSLSENATFTGGYQEARNLARLFSRTDYIALVPVSILWMTDIQRSFRHHLHLLQEGHLLIVPTFGFPYYNVDDEIDHDTLPRDKQTTVEWVEEGKMGLLDYHYELNNGPTSYSTWKEAREPYIVPTYDYQYGPIFISSKTNHPWCEERFEDNMASCLYTTYLAGADLWILPNDYVIRTGHEPADTLYTPQQRKIHNRLAKRYRMEQCVFYARQFDQYGAFDKAHHVKQECSKALLSLQKEKMISGYLTE